MVKATTTLRREQLVYPANVLFPQIRPYAPTSTGCDFFRFFGAGPFWFIAR